MHLLWLSGYRDIKDDKGLVCRNGVFLRFSLSFLRRIKEIKEIRKEGELPSKNLRIASDYSIVSLIEIC